MKISIFFVKKLLTLIENIFISNYGQIVYIINSGIDPLLSI